MEPEANLYITQSNEMGRQFFNNEQSLVPFGKQVMILCQSDVDKLPLL